MAEQKNSICVSIVLCHWELYWKFRPWKPTQAGLVHFFFYKPSLLLDIVLCTVQTDWCTPRYKSYFFEGWTVNCVWVHMLLHGFVFWTHFSLSADYCRPFYTVCHKCVSRFILTLLHSTFVSCVHQQTLTWVTSDFLLWNHVKWWK